MKKTLLVALFAVALIACDKKPDTSGYKLEMEDREVMRVTSGQLLDFAFAKGKVIADSLDHIKSLANAPMLMKKFADSLQIKYQIELAVVDSTSKNADNKLMELLEAYQYNVVNGVKSEDNIQKSNSGDTLFFTRVNEIKGTFAGILVLKMPKKELIKRITIKDLKTKG